MKMNLVCWNTVIHLPYLQSNQLLMEIDLVATFHFCSELLHYNGALNWGVEWSREDKQAHHFELKTKRIEISKHDRD